MKYEPGRLEMFLTRLALLFCGKSVYKAFADRLPLDGGEQVLDFGCGMGTVAFYTAKKLPRGHLTCMDISRRWLNACRKTLRGYGNVIYMRWEPPVSDNEGIQAYESVFANNSVHASGAVGVNKSALTNEGVPEGKSVLAKESFDAVYCHFVLHEIPDSELVMVIPLLVGSLKPGGVLVFREPLDETGKIGVIKSLIGQNGLALRDSRITDIPLMGNALESIYIKQ